MELTERELWEIVRSCRNAQNEEEFQIQLQEWIEIYEKRPEIDEEFLKRLKQKEPLVLYNGVRMTEKIYNELNERLDFKWDVITLMKTGFKAYGDDNESKVVEGRTVRGFIQLIFEKLDIMEIYRKENKDTIPIFYFEGRTLQLDEKDTVIDKKYQFQHKIGMIQELVDLWIDGKTKKVKSNIDLLTCIKTKRILLQILSVFKKDGVLKTYEEYEEDVRAVCRAIDGYINKSINKEVDYEKQLCYMIKQDCFKELATKLEGIDKKAKNIFYASLIDWIHESASEATVMAEDYIRVYEEMKSDKRMDKVWVMLANEAKSIVNYY